MSVEVTFLAEADIDLAYEELATNIGTRVADLFQRRLAEMLAKLERQPLSIAKIDPPFPEYPDLRVVAIKRFEARLICYFPISTGIRVVRVIHSSRDLAAVFGS